MKILALAFFFILTLQNIVTGQDSGVDILDKKLRRAETPELRADALLHLAGHYATRDSIYARYYLNELYDLIENKNLNRFLSSAYLEEGILNYYSDLYPEASSCFFKSENALKEIFDVKVAARLWLFWGNMHALRSEYDSSLIKYQRAYSYYEQADDLKGMSDALFAMASEHFSQGNHEYSLHYHNRAYALRISLQDSARIANSLIGLARIAEQQDSLSKSLGLLKEALRLREMIGDKRRVASSHLGLGSYYIEHGKPGLAPSHLTTAFDIFEGLNERTGMTYALLKTSEAYILNEEFDSALSTLDESCRLSKNIDNPSLIAECYKIRSRLMESMGEHDQSLSFYKRYTKLNDSINNSEKERRFSELEVKYLSQQKSARIEKLEAKEKLSRQRAVILISGVFLLLLVIVFIMIFYRQKNQKLHYRNRLLESEKELQKQRMELQERQQKELQERLEYQEKELASKALSIYKTSSLMEETVNQLDALCANEKKQTSVPHEINGITNNLKSFARRDLWEDFEHSFTKVHTGFYKTLLEKAPDLTASEIRIASLIRLNLTTKEICAITLRSESSIKSIRFRLRKKLEISGDDNLTAKIMSL